MSIRKIFITGASGFIGKAVLSRLVLKQIDVVAPVRNLNNCAFGNVQTLLSPDVCNLPDCLSRVIDVDIVIHIAAKAHDSDAYISHFRQINTVATLNLARVAGALGVKRFIFLSSIGVNGISNCDPFAVNDSPQPVEPYAISKFEAEEGLKRVAADTGMEIIIIRPPLVYGANAPGNFGKLAKLARRNVPFLPLGSIRNKRSIVALDNLVDLIITCIDHPKAANQTFLVSDDQDVSTTELLQMMTRAAGKKSRLLPVPVSWLKLAGKLTGKQAVIDRLCGNLQVDISHTKNTLGWKPPISVEEGIRRCFVKEESA